MKEATRRHFFFHGKDGHEEEKAKCHLCQIRLFPSQSTYPVTIINEVDATCMDPDFRFVDTSIYGAGVEPARDEFRSGCECPDAQSCQYSSCTCLQELDEGEYVSSGDDDNEGGDDHDDDDGEEENESQTAEANGDQQNGHMPAQRKRKAYAYHRAGLLRPKVLASRAPIYECHSACACGLSCRNRVVERGRTVPLQIFRTPDRGWGVRSTVDIKKGQFIDKYVGEIITPEEAESRRAASDIAQRKDIYLFALDKFSDPESLDERLRAPPLLVDGEFMSGPSRFVNHSCEPNCRIFARVGDHADKHIHDLALFALRDVGKGEELTFDYVDGDEGEDDGGRKEDMTRCRCGSEKCRGWLW